jgi:hypothetical protein
MKTINRYRCPVCKQEVTNQKTLAGKYRTTKTYKSFCATTGKNVTMRRVTGPRKKVASKPNAALLRAAKNYFKQLGDRDKKKARQAINKL